MCPIPSRLSERDHAQLHHVLAELVRAEPALADTLECAIETGLSLNLRDAAARRIIELTPIPDDLEGLIRDDEA